MNTQLASIADPSKRELIMKKITALEGQLQGMLQKKQCNECTRSVYKS